MNNGDLVHFRADCRGRITESDKVSPHQRDAVDFFELAGYDNIVLFSVRFEVFVAFGELDGFIVGSRRMNVSYVYLENCLQTPRGRLEAVAEEYVNVIDLGCEQFRLNHCSKNTVNYLRTTLALAIATKAQARMILANIFEVLADQGNQVTFHTNRVAFIRKSRSALETSKAWDLM